MLQGILNAFSSTLRGEQANHHAQRAPQVDKKDSFAATLAQIEPGSVNQPSAVENFLAYQKLSIAEKIRAAYLAAKDLTEEQLAALPPEEQLKIEQMIKDEIKRKLDPAQG